MVSSFRNREHAQQLIDFHGIKHGKCSATDIDMSLDWQGKVFVFVEYKWGNGTLSPGQRYHLENLVNAINAGGKKAIAILATHDTPKGSDVDAGAGMVAKVYTGRKEGWNRDPAGVTVKTYLDGMYIDFRRGQENAA